MTIMLGMFIEKLNNRRLPRDEKNVRKVSSMDDFKKSVSFISRRYV